MSDLSFVEKSKLERVLNMGSGYVLEFSNRTFADFFADSVGVNIDDQKYSTSGSSKANRMRAFWVIEQNFIVGKVLSELLGLAKSQPKPPDESLLGECQRIADRLRQGAPVFDFALDELQQQNREFQLLERMLRQAIDNNLPESALDHLHTFTVKYLRSLFQKRGIDTPRDKPLHSLIGEYAKLLRAAGTIESDMTERILKMSISVMESFNHVRNERSLAHDNTVLPYNESLLIFSHVMSAIRFIESVERPREASPTGPSNVEETSEIPF